MKKQEWTTAGLFLFWRLSGLFLVWEMFQNKTTICGKWLCEIRLYAQMENPGEGFIMLNFHLMEGLIAYGRWAWESPAVKILALIAQDWKIKYITTGRI